MNSISQSSEHVERLAAVLKHIPVFLFQQDRQLRYTWIYNTIPGQTTGDILGQRDEDLLDPEAAGELVRVKRAVLADQETRRVVIPLRCAPRICQTLWWISPLFAENGEIEGLTGMVIELAGAAQSEARARLLASLSRSFAETESSYPAILDIVARLVAQFAGEACYIRLIDEERHAMAPAAFAHIDPSRERAWHAMAAEMAEAARASLLPGSAVETGGQRIEDLMSREDLLARLPDAFRKWLLANPIHAVMILPMRTPRAALGVLSIWRARSLEPFTAEDQSFWQDVVDHAALAIDNARLYAEEVHRNRQLNALHDATSALLTTLDLDVLLGRILDAAQTAIPTAERGVLYLVARGTGRLEVRATSGFSDPRIRRTGQLHNAHARRAMRERQALLIHDAAPPPESGGAPPAEPDPFRSAIFAPLVLGAEVLGMLSLSSSQPLAFTSSDLQLLTSFAVTTTAALHNAMLHAEVQKIAITDPLTGLYNRRGMLALGRHEIERFQRYGSPLSVIMLDIDHFKVVNDTYGHSIGDQVLCRLADRCRALVRMVDIFGRYGGEEFAVILPGTDLFQAAEIAERLRASVEAEPFHTDQGPISITVSIGVSRSGQNSTDLEEIIGRSDVALYRAKQAGRNRVEIG